MSRGIPKFARPCEYADISISRLTTLLFAWDMCAWDGSNARCGCGACTGSEKSEGAGEPEYVDEGAGGDAPCNCGYACMDATDIELWASQDADMLSSGEMNNSCCEATPPGSELNIGPKSKDASNCVPEPVNALVRNWSLNRFALISGIGDGSRGMPNG